jgi:GDPmannose 4,6-dehydratase|tara:strand:+ start:3026 stop:4012 length:987 start_codon:yes stop_codon:yes gene_type:complete
MKAIIFGITGQDGSHLADLLLSKDYHVVGVSRRASTDNTQRIKHILGNKRFELVQGDITDAHSVINILKKHEDVDEIYNLAAQSHVAVSFKQPALTWDITGKGCLNILQSIVDLGINSRFYQASSSEMYGKHYDELSPGNKFQNEDTKFMPQSPYAIAKCAAHHMTRLFREAYGLHASAGILFNHEGERRGETFVTRKITKWIGDWVKSGRDLNFPKLRLGNLEAFRDWGYAGDYVEAMWMMLQQDSPQDFVICTGETHTIREFLDVAFSHIGIDDWSDLVIQDPEFYRPAEVDYLRGDCSKAGDVLGWTPKHSFEDLVKLMVDHDTV